MIRGVNIELRYKNTDTKKRFPLIFRNFKIEHF